jgi:predicted translin family RNA/ssDNA-binding protein
MTATVAECFKDRGDALEESNEDKFQLEFKPDEMHQVLRKLLQALTDYDHLARSGQCHKALVEYLTTGIVPERFK